MSCNRAIGIGHRFSRTKAQCPTTVAIGRGSNMNPLRSFPAAPSYA